MRRKKCFTVLKQYIYRGLRDVGWVVSEGEILADTHKAMRSKCPKATQLSQVAGSDSARE